MTAETSQKKKEDLQLFLKDEAALYDDMNIDDDGDDDGDGDGNGKWSRL